MSQSTLDLDQLVIDPTELQSAIEIGLDQTICIVDLSSQESYASGHIPGAVFLPFQALLNGNPPVPGKIASKEQIATVFAYLGLTRDTHFIVYDDEGGGWAGRFIWTLDIIGHEKYSYLNGGLQAWKHEGFELEQQENVRTETSPTISFDIEKLIEIPDIISGLEESSIQIWDARSPAEYNGQRVMAAKGGHIPGAINCEWTELMDHDHGLRIRKDAQSALQAIGISGEQPIVTHCQSHHRSGFTYLVGKTLGFNIRAYHGSWSEWGNHPDTPVEL